MRFRNLRYWAAVSFCVEIAVVEVLGWLRFALTSTLQGPDFYIYYATSLLLLKRGPAVVYDFTIQKQFQDQVTSQWGGQFILLPHILPPWVTLLFYPLGLLSLRAAYILWGATIILLVAAAIAILLRAARLRGRAALLAAAAAAASLPVFVLLVQGNSDAPMVAAVAAAALAWTTGRQARAGVFAALGLVKPQLVLLLPVLFLVRRSWRAVAAFAGVCAALLAISLLVFGPAACLAWLKILGPWAFGGQINYPVDTQSQFSLRGLLQFVGLPLSLQLVVLAIGFLGVAVVLYRSGADARLQLALAIAGSLALSPYQHAHDLSLMIVPGMLLGGALPILRHPRLGAAFLIAGWLGLELLIYTPLFTALAVVGATAFLAYECVFGDSLSPALRGSTVEGGDGDRPVIESSPAASSG
jgi:alpha-1,2-mannosyltransferase